MENRMDDVCSTKHTKDTKKKQGRRGQRIERIETNAGNGIAYESHEVSLAQPTWEEPEFGPQKTRKNTEKAADEEPFRVLTCLLWTEVFARKQEVAG
jgi:hypothetical protein